MEVTKNIEKYTGVDFLVTVYICYHKISPFFYSIESENWKVYHSLEFMMMNVHTLCRRQICIIRTDKISYIYIDNSD